MFLKGEPKTVVAAFAALLVTVVLYLFFLRSMEAPKRNASRNA